MTVTAVRASSAKQKKSEPPSVFTCQFCKNGHHGSCPRVVWHTKAGKRTLWTCICPLGEHPGKHCTECRNEDLRDIDPNRWVCLDRHACATRLEARRNNSRLWQSLQAAKSHAAIIRRAKRLHAERVLLGIDPSDDEKIEDLQGRLDTLMSAKAAERASNRVREPKPKVGKCECCGEPTRGGKFLPGHDAKLASALRLRVKCGDQEAYKEMERRGWLKKLPDALRNGI